MPPSRRPVAPRGSARSVCAERADGRGYCSGETHRLCVNAEFPNAVLASWELVAMGRAANRDAPERDFPSQTAQRTSTVTTRRNILHPHDALHLLTARLARRETA